MDHTCTIERSKGGKKMSPSLLRDPWTAYFPHLLSLGSPRFHGGQSGLHPNLPLEISVPSNPSSSPSAWLRVHAAAFSLSIREDDAKVDRLLNQMCVSFTHKSAFSVSIKRRIVNF